MKATALKLPESVLEAAGLGDCKEGDLIKLAIKGKVSGYSNGVITISATSLKGSEDSGAPHENEEDDTGEAGPGAHSTVGERAGGESNEEQETDNEMGAAGPSDTTQGQTGVDYLVAMRKKKMRGTDH